MRRASSSWLSRRLGFAMPSGEALRTPTNNAKGEAGHDPRGWTSGCLDRGCTSRAVHCQPLGPPRVAARLRAGGVAAGSVSAGHCSRGLERRANNGVDRRAAVGLAVVATRGRSRRISWVSPNRRALGDRRPSRVRGEHDERLLEPTPAIAGGSAQRDGLPRRGLARPFCQADDTLHGGCPRAELATSAGSAPAWSPGAGFMGR